MAGPVDMRIAEKLSAEKDVPSSVSHSGNERSPLILPFLCSIHETD